MDFIRNIVERMLICYLFFLQMGIICFGQTKELSENLKLSTEASKDSAQVYNLIILAGQSNMVGSGKKDQIQVPFISDNITYYNYGKRMNLQIVSEDTFGPEIGIMEQLSIKFPNKKFIILKYAVGGASMYGWSPERDEKKVEKMGHPHFGKMSDSLFKYTDLAIKGKITEPIAFVWMQGETDARFEIAGQEYASNFQKLIEKVRKEYHKEDLPIIFGKVNPIASRYPGLLALQSSQRYIAKNIANTYVVDTDGLEKRSDSLHYSSEGLLGLGERFGKILVKIIEEKY